MFWNRPSFVFVGHSARKGSPKLSYGAAKKLPEAVALAEQRGINVRGT